MEELGDDMADVEDPGVKTLLIPACRPDVKVSAEHLDIMRVLTML